ncbi:MAG: DUF5011 domain-containing protein, partial [Phaeodactylibacter sp.]|nr:DUF5011 domain-containing protein [Phaeodactylibacter sp.]
MPYYLEADRTGGFRRLTPDSSFVFSAGDRLEFDIALYDEGSTERLIALKAFSTNDALVAASNNTLRLYVNGSFSGGGDLTPHYGTRATYSIEWDGSTYTVSVNNVVFLTANSTNSIELGWIGANSAFYDFYGLRYYNNGSLITNNVPPSSGTTISDTETAGNDLSLGSWAANYVLYYSIDSIDKTTFKPSEDVTFSVTPGYTPTSATLSDGTKTLTGIELVSTGTTNQYRINIPMGDAAGFPDFGDVTLTLSDGTTTVEQALTFTKPDALTEATLSGAVIKDETSVSFTFPAHPQLGNKYYYDATKITISNNNVLSIVAGATFETIAYLMDNQGLQQFTVSESQATAATTPPVITILGDNPATVTEGSTYSDAGATATDDTDGDITSSISVSSNVNTSAAGSYTVTYDVSDAAGNNTQATRTVNVEEALPVLYSPRHFTTFNSTAQMYGEFSSPITLSGDFEIEWNAQIPSAGCYFFADTSSTSGSQRFGITAAGDVFGFNNSGGTWGVSIVHGILLSSFHLVRQSGVIELFINGASIATQPLTSAVTINSCAAPFAGVTSVPYLNGIISDLKIIDNGTTVFDAAIDRPIDPQNNIVDNTEVVLGANIYVNPVLPSWAAGTPYTDNGDETYTTAVGEPVYL